MTIQRVALKNLFSSDTNARTVRHDDAVTEMAASLEAHGQLQPMKARKIKKGKNKGGFEVYIGETRRLAFLALIEQGKMTPDSEVDVVVTEEGDEEAREKSLAENVIRRNMHPAEQFERFTALAAQNKTPDQIAVRFGTAPLHVERMLKLASVSPRLFDVFRKNEMNIAQLQAFTVNADHAAQEAAWFDVQSYDRDPRSIRNRLTRTAKRADAQLVKFVGLDAYLAAGGNIERDLFDASTEGYLTDPQIIDTLVAKKLEGEVAALEAEGWGEVVIERGYIYRHNLRIAEGKDAPLSEADQIKLDEASARRAQIDEETDEDAEYSEELSNEIDTLEAVIESLTDNRPQIFTPEQKALCRAIVNLNDNGVFTIHRGVLIAETDEIGTNNNGGGSSEGAEKKPKERAEHSAKLVARLTAHRTAALRAELATNPHVALAATVHALIGQRGNSCLTIKFNEANIDQGEDVPGSAAVTSFDSLRKQTAKELPKGAALFPWLVEQDTETLLRLLAIAAAQSVDVVNTGAHEFSQHFLTETEQRHGDQLAVALDLDMRKWWTPTATGYFDHVSKTVLLSAVTEAAGAQAAANIEGMKKAAAAGRAEILLASTSWLPGLLRRSDMVTVVDAPDHDEEESNEEGTEDGGLQEETALQDETARDGEGGEDSAIQTEPTHLAQVA